MCWDNDPTLNKADIIVSTIHGVKGMEAYTGYQQVGIARDQNEMARQNLGFQQAAWGKDYEARRIAYNQNARGRIDWKRANDPLGERYSVEELVPA